MEVGAIKDPVRIHEKATDEYGLRFSDGSLGTLVYSTMGSAGCPKEQIQVFGGGKTAILSDFQKLETWDSENRAQGHQSRVRDKGQKVQIAETVEAFRKGTSPIPLEQLMEGALAVLAAPHVPLRADGRPILERLHRLDLTV